MEKKKLWEVETGSIKVYVLTEQKEDAIKKAIGNIHKISMPDDVLWNTWKERDFYENATAIELPYIL